LGTPLALAPEQALQLDLADVQDIPCLGPRRFGPIDPTSTAGEVRGRLLRLDVL
jgi:hypothetical protein